MTGKASSLSVSTWVCVVSSFQEEKTCEADLNPTCVTGASTKGTVNISPVCSCLSLCAPGSCCHHLPGDFFPWEISKRPSELQRALCTQPWLSWRKHRWSVPRVTPTTRLWWWGWGTQRGGEPQKSRATVIRKESWVLEDHLVHKIVALGLVVIPAMRFLMDTHKQNRYFQGRLLLRSWNHGQLKAISSCALISLNCLEKTARPIVCFFQKCVLRNIPMNGQGLILVPVQVLSLSEGTVTGFSLEDTGAYQRFLLSAFPVSFCKCVWFYKFFS